MNTQISPVILQLQEGLTDYKRITRFSDKPGIYAIGFIGNEFPLLADMVARGQIIYIGKTESSQEKRDHKTHFDSGKTGSSTVRKSIGALLCLSENLKPIPRNNNDYLKGRHSQFKFDDQGEEIIPSCLKRLPITPGDAKSPYALRVKETARRRIAVARMVMTYSLRCWQTLSMMNMKIT